MSESLTVEGWRVREDLAVDLVGALELPVEESSKPRRYRRGELVRRTLAARGCRGPRPRLSLLASCSCPTRARSATGSAPGMEYLALLLAIPFWLLLLRLEGLYDRDEERTDHSTVDDIVGVFRSVTIGVWVFALFGVATHLVQPVLGRLGIFWLARGPPDPDPARRRAHAVPPPARLRAECRHRRRGARRPAARAEAPQPSRVRHQPRRVRRRSADGARRRARGTASVPSRRPGPAARVSSWSTVSSA